MALPGNAQYVLEKGLANKDVAQAILADLTALESGLPPASASPTLTALAGGGQAGATALASYINRLGTVATAADSVMLPVSAPATGQGQELVVINDGAAAAQIFANSAGTDTINGIAGATGVSLAVGGVAVFRSVQAGKWLYAPGTGYAQWNNESTIAYATGVFGVGALTGSIFTAFTNNSNTSGVTTRTAAQMIADWPGAVDRVGFNWKLRIANSVTVPITITGGTGVTFADVNGTSGSTHIVNAGTYDDFVAVTTSSSTIRFRHVGSGKITQLPSAVDNTVVTGTGTMASGAMEGAEFVTLTASAQAGITLTTRTAAQIQANVGNWHVGKTYRLRIINTNTGTLTTTGGANVTMTSTIPSNHFADYTILFATATTITTNQVTVAPISALNPVAGVAAGYRVARGVHTQVAASDTVVTGLSLVVACSVSPKTRTVKQLLFNGDIGTQAGAPAAGSILITSQKPTAVNDVTPTAATDFTDNIDVHWIAIGT